MLTVRCLVRALSAPGAVVAVLLAVSCLVLAVPAVQASASDIQHQSPDANAADTRGIAISITGMTPQIATPSATVTVTGTLANHTGSTASGITVQAQTSTALFTGRAEMTSFERSGGYPYLIQPAGSPEVTGTVPSGATVRWSASFPASTFYDRFGVFPIQVTAIAPRGGYTVTARTFLPYWPGGSAGSLPKQLQVAWVWPLVDTPQQGACSKTLATSRLASSVASGGRLTTLLGAGATWAQEDQLTWVIDPALLSDVSVMTRQYSISGATPSAACTGRFTEKASPAASEWLSKLRATTAGQPAFLTPYANVDVAALSHAGLDASIRTAFQLGDTMAGQVLPNTFGSNSSSTGDGAVLKAAWPADGLADAGVVTSLASDGGVSTVVLSSDELPSSTPGYDNALGRTTSGIGTSVSVLLADSGITRLLGSASPAPTESGQFGFVQDFLAQTAMISSEAPNLARSLVIAPPTSWDPSPAEAAALLSISHGGAPWLRPVSLSALATDSAKLPSTPLPAKQVSRAELSATYLDHARQVQASAALFTNLLYQPPASVVTSLQAAVTATTSAAWRGSGSPGGGLAIGQLARYLSDSEHKVQIIPGKKLFLAGTSGKTFVSVRNLLDLPVQVRVVATTPPGSQLVVGPFTSLLIVAAGKTNSVPMPVQSNTIGTSTVQLKLVTEDGAPLTWTAQLVSVEVTRFGRALLIIIGGALGVLVLTSVFRLRRKRKARAAQRGTASEMANAGGAG
jgi:Family of unknown function (DUF6049)